jgi:hypothetical protein
LNLWMFAQVFDQTAKRGRFEFRASRGIEFHSRFVA